MITAMLYPDPAKLRRKGSSGTATGQQFSKQLLSNARTVLRVSPGVEIS